MHFNPDMLPAKGCRFERSQQVAGSRVFTQCFKMMCICAGADLCAVGHDLILFAVQSMAPHAGRTTQGKGHHHRFYGGDAVQTFPSIVKQSKKKTPGNDLCFLSLLLLLFESDYSAPDGM